MKENKKMRFFGLDLLRIFCCIGIIGLHETGHIFQYNGIWAVHQAIVRPCLWTFVAISGFFILKEPINNLKNYYFKRIPSLLLPLFIYCILLSLINNIDSGNKLFFGLNITYFKLLFTGVNSGHLWFIYSMIGVYLIAPFLQKMLFSLSNKQIKFLVLITIFFMCINPILSVFNLKMTSDIIFNNIFVFYFILGYSFNRLNFNKYKTTIFFVGTLNFLFLIYAKNISILSDTLYTTGINMVIGVIFYFTLFFGIKCFNKKICNIISFISSKTYGVYIVHLTVLMKISDINIFFHNSNNYLYMPVIKIIIIFFISLFIASIVDYIFLKPAKLVYKKILSEFRTK